MFSELEPYNTNRVLDQVAILSHIANLKAMLLQHHQSSFNLRWYGHRGHTTALTALDHLVHVEICALNLFFTSLDNEVLFTERANALVRRLEELNKEGVFCTSEMESVAKSLLHYCKDALTSYPRLVELAETKPKEINNEQS